MKLEFKSIRISSFMSVGEIEINLKDRGLTLVRGVNNYEPKLDSNGSGKSSIFDSILWCLLGYTSRDVNHVSNENTDTGARVELELSINGADYVIIRTENPKTLSIVRNGEDISGNTYTKSQSILNNELGWINYDSIISIIILSQGLPGRFTSLKPKDRKSRLEYLSGIDNDLIVLIDKVNSVISDINSSKYSLSSSISEISGKIMSNTSIIKSSQQKIAELKMRTPISEHEYEELKQEYDDRNKKYSEFNLEINSLSSEVNKRTREYYELENEIKMNERYVADIQRDLASYLDSKCPTCGSHIDCSEQITECTTKISDLLKSLEDKNPRVSSLNLEIENINRQISYLRDKSANILDGQNERNQKIRDYETTKTSISIYEESVKNSEEQIEELSNLKTSIENELGILEKKLEIANFYKNNLNKKFRTFLLNEVIEFMNKLLSDLSGYLYEVQGKVRLESSGNDIKIYLGDREFGALSGGEGRRVDLILQLAQRHLCEVQSGFSCNLLVIDEILDYLDAVGVDNVLSLIESNSTNVDTLMLVTHRPDLNITFDSILTVLKDENQISRLSM